MHFKTCVAFWCKALWGFLFSFIWGYYVLHKSYVLLLLLLLLLLTNVDPCFSSSKVFWNLRRIFYQTKFMSNVNFHNVLVFWRGCVNFFAGGVAPLWSWCKILLVKFKMCFLLYLLRLLDSFNTYVLIMDLLEKLPTVINICTTDVSLRVIVITCVWIQLNKE